MAHSRLGSFLLCSILLIGLWGTDKVLAAGDGYGRNESAESGVFHTAGVKVDGHVLFRIRGISSFPAEERARAVSSRIKDAAADSAVSPDSLKIEETDGFSVIRAGDRVLIQIVDADAELEGISRRVLARVFLEQIEEGILLWRSNRDPEKLRRNVLIALGATLVLILVLGFARWIYRRLMPRLEARLKEKVRDINIQKFRLIRGEQLWSLLIGVLRFLWGGFVLVSGYFYLYSVLILFPWTSGIAESLFHVLIRPVEILGFGLIEEFPNIVFLVILFIVFRALLKLVRLFFSRLADGSVVLSGFEAEWALPTYRLVRLLLIAFALMIAYPYIPGSDTGAFKGLSIFFGLLFSLGSSSLVGNFIAGYTMIYRRDFRVGDRIKVGEHLGDVEQRRLLCTYLRTLKNEEVVIPNSNIINGEVVNYTTRALQRGLILHTTIGIGYETPWRQVESMLLQAAARTSNLLSKPSPFVLQKGLGDFCITYEINAYCHDPKNMDQILSDLHRNILDIFNEYGVQIMTPAYEGDPEEAKVVPREKWYIEPATPGQTGDHSSTDTAELPG